MNSHDENQIVDITMSIINKKRIAMENKKLIAEMH